MPITDAALLTSLESIVAEKGLSDAEKIEKMHEKHAVIVNPKGVDLFFTFYFVMTGIHGAHVVIGMTVLAIVMVKAAKGRYTHWYYTPIENGGLYWHLVDLIWIYLFPLMYLIK
ncbi:MAG: cytochrome c oxidase subunit 3 [Spirochaetia bacterium]|nr:cytochrome c oxidase subunit 3 [Spirochaetia bacterium]